MESSSTLTRHERRAGHEANFCAQRSHQADDRMSLLQSMQDEHHQQAHCMFCINDPTTGNAFHMRTQIGALILSAHCPTHDYGESTHWHSHGPESWTA